MAGLNRIPELVSQGRRAGSDLGYVVTRRMGFGSDVPPRYVDFASEMLGEIPWRSWLITIPRSATWTSFGRLRF